jgi:predicted short-subunit dehydrogenase-like oxidoreductase (DUF2520 family)
MAGPDEPVAIAGAGRMAQALGRLLREAGVPVAAVASRNPDRARAAARWIGAAAVGYEELPLRAARILIAVPDDAIACVARVLAGGGMREGAVLHTSGARGPEVLAGLAERGVSCGALHPIQTVATPEQGLAALHGAYFGITAEGPALEWAAELVSLAGGRALRVPADRRALYHAASVMASNYVVGLAGAAVILMEAAGIEPPAALEALAPLMRAGVENAVRLGPAGALTGPVERGDVDTIAAHLRALEAVPERVRELYRVAGLHLLELAGRPADPRHAALEKLLRHA